MFDLDQILRTPKKTLILCVFSPYSILSYLIHDYNLKLVSLEYVLTRVRIFSMIAQIILPVPERIIYKINKNLASLFRDNNMQLYYSIN